MPCDNVSSPLPVARPSCLVVDPHPALFELVGASLETEEVATALRSTLVD